MGMPMLQRLTRGGHDVVGFDLAEDAAASCVEFGATAAPSLEVLVSNLRTPRRVWVMLPAGDPTNETIRALSTMLQANDVIVDGGNSHYREAALRSRELAAIGIHFLDVGTSGGVRGLTEGFSLMIGGPEGTIDSLEPIFATLAPAPDRGWGRVGPVGAGHFVKMVHNGIEYGAMQAFAEGFAILEAKGDFDLDLERVSSIWQHGSVVRSWLLDLVSETLADDATLERIAPVVADSGEGRWTVQEAIDLGVSAPVITLSLLARLKSRDEEGFSERLLAALRNRFGGHAIEQVGLRDE
jgi:6-phosphogluconate dehydrogenase